MLERLAELKIIPVVAIDSCDDAKPLADALTAGGLPIAEITLRTDAGLDAIGQLSDRADFLVGAGTVHGVDQARRAADAGARFIVSPGFHADTVQWCLDHAIPIYPGVATATDLERALEFGLDVVKFFPAEQLGGVRMIRALAAPFASIRFIPTGGISIDNLSDYLDLPCVLACGGTWMVKPALINEGNFAEITRLTAEAVGR